MTIIHINQILFERSQLHRTIHRSDRDVATSHPLILPKFQRSPDKPFAGKLNHISINLFIAQGEAIKINFKWILSLSEVALDNYTLSLLLAQCTQPALMPNYF